MDLYQVETKAGLAAAFLAAAKPSVKEARQAPFKV